MSIRHAKILTRPNNPAKEVSTDAWNMGIDVPVDITPNKYGSLVQSLFEKKRKNEEEELLLILAGYLA